MENLRPHDIGLYFVDITYKHFAVCLILNSIIIFYLVTLFFSFFLKNKIGLLKNFLNKGEYEAL